MFLGTCEFIWLERKNSIIKWCNNNNKKNAAEHFSSKYSIGF